MEILGYASAILIGMLLGLTGGGGSILTVPVLVYLLKLDPATATTYSLFIVGMTSLAGGAKTFTNKQIDFKAVMEFAIPSLISVFITRHYLLPAIPDVITVIGNIPITKNILLMLVFALSMLFASIGMIRGSQKDESVLARCIRNKELFLILCGFTLGIITGLVGAGGGFLIIPALVLFIRVPMKIAIGTSLVIISINPLFGFFCSLDQFKYDWTMLVLFTAIAVAGVFLGRSFLKRSHQLP